MKKKKRASSKRSVEQTISQKRNWVKRMVSCYTAGYQTVINQYQDSISPRERANIAAMITTGKLMLDSWETRKEE